VTTIIAQAVPIDILARGGAAVIWMLLGISVGVLAARRPRSLWDRGATVFVLTGVSMPTFILGLLLLYVLYYLLTIHGSRSSRNRGVGLRLPKTRWNGRTT